MGPLLVANGVITPIKDVINWVSGVITPISGSCLTLLKTGFLGPQKTSCDSLKFQHPIGHKPIKPKPASTTRNLAQVQLSWKPFLPCQGKGMEKTNPGGDSK